VNMHFTWSVAGVVSERRELRSKDGRVFKHIVKVATVGSMAELAVDARDYDRLTSGMEVEASGTFDFYMGKAGFVASRIEPVAKEAVGKIGAGAAPGASQPGKAAA
jgi:hypothetical protein